jgi:hypothetical protein
MIVKLYNLHVTYHFGHFDYFDYFDPLDNKVLIIYLYLVFFGFFC